FGVQFEVTSYPQRAIAARLRCERPHGQVARQWFGDGDIVALLPLGGMAGNSVALVWSVQEARADELLRIPPEEFQARLQAACHDALGRMTLTTDRMAWPLQRAQADRWCGPGWVLAGDAAHNVHPLAGQGLNLGLADVAALAGVIAAREPWRPLGDERLLRRYARARLAPTLAMGELTDVLQRLFAHPSPAAQGLRNRGLDALNQLAPVKRWLTQRALGL
ncbi:MAG TPA: FAD-dependent monooxygenase, partial [Roseateles sp.]|uniref:FAD-dependent monooxygenase n=1 Tax=Roseateles sp. TaxID=1971397 RepID=UPI002EDA4079